jgi:hypothetical protein
MRTIIAGCGLALTVALGTGQPALAAHTHPALTPTAQGPGKTAPPAKKHPVKKGGKQLPKEQPTKEQPAQKQPAGENAADNQPTGKPVSSSTCPAGTVACQNRLSATTQNEQNTFDLGGAQIGEGITDMISGAVVGLSTLGLDVLQDVGHIF